MPIFDVSPQGTSAWLVARRGCITASKLNDVLAETKQGKPAAAREQYLNEILSERGTDYYEDHYVSKAMEHGIEYEPFARSRYEEETGRIVQEVGFALHDTIEFFGASSDGLVGHDGMIEIKCCTMANHAAILRSREIPERFKNQMIGQCLVLQREWCDFVAYDPRWRDREKQIFIKRFTPTQEELLRVEAGVLKFIEDLDKAWDAECEKYAETLLNPTATEVIQLREDAVKRVRKKHNEEEAKEVMPAPALVLTPEEDDFPAPPKKKSCAGGAAQ